MREIFIYTSYYPYSIVSESFLTPELKVFSRQRIHVSIIPVNFSDVKREVPKGIILDSGLCRSGFFTKLWSLLSVLCYIRFFDFDHLRQKIKPRSLYSTIKYLYAANLVYQDLRKRALVYENAIFYSYWLSYTPIAFALYKYKYPKTSHKFIARGHGSDIYGDKVGIYYPFRDFVFNKLDQIYVISSYGKQYLLERYPQLYSKIQIARLGVFSNYVKKKKEKIVRMVSCSNVIPLKRVSLIYRSISNFANNHPEYQMEWIHIGDGPLFSEIKEIVTHNTTSNLTCTLKGSLNNEEILRLYRKKAFTAFILLSTTEGIPVSIMEAISSGIPVIATNVGGVNEIVTKDTGFLLDKDFKQIDFDMACLDVIQYNERLMVSSYDFFRKNFDAEANFNSFCNKILRQ